MEGRILLVDDNVEFVDSMKDILEDEGYDCHTATNGLDAISLAEKNLYDVVLMDIKMPGMNGVECFLKMKERNSGVKVIMFTAYALTELIRKAEQEGVCAILKKPLNMNVFTETIKKVKGENVKGRILVADDDKSLCDNLCEVLSDSGYEVSTAFDGEQAVRTAAGKKIDILLLDMKMPGLNGLEVFQRVKALQPGIAAIVITGYAMEMKDLIQKCMEENAFAYLAKPLEISRLVDLIKQITLEKANGANPDGG